LPARLEITQVPAGEAPAWVRECWVGLRLPLALRRTAPMSLRVSGVLSGPKTRLGSLVGWLRGEFARHAGYVVRVSDAMAALEPRHPAAAAWWRQHAPHLFRGRRYFVFDVQAGRIVTDEAAP
jgi:hypothetical protein